MSYTLITLDKFHFILTLLPLQGNPLVLSVNNYEILVDPHTSLVFSYVFLIFNDTDIKTVIEVNINKI